MFLRVVRLLLPLVLIASSAALDPNRRITQYAHSAWRIQDGVFSGAPHAITQTTDGYLWIGTEGGLLRFDGVRFVPWTPPDKTKLPSTRIYSLLGARDGSLWIGTGAGLAHWKDGQLADYPSAPGFVESIVQDASGTIWMTRSQVHDNQGPLCRVEANKLHCYGPADGIPFPYAQPLAKDHLGNLWIGSSLGVCRWKPGSVNIYLPPGLKRASGLMGVSAIAEGANDTLWVGMERSGSGLGLEQLIRGAWKSYMAPELPGASLEVSALLADRDGSLWVGTTNRGIYRIRGSEADNFRGADGLSSNSVSGFFQDREGNLWVITSRGIDRFHDTSVVSFSIREGLSGEGVGSVLSARDGTVWIGNVEALDFLRQGKLSAIGARSGLPGRLVTSLLQDDAGRLWVGIDAGLTVYENGRFRPITKPDGNPLGVVTAMAEDLDHNIWVESTQPALFRIRDFQVREEIDPPKIPRPSSLTADPEGGIWLGLTTGNLARYRQNNLETFSPDFGRIRNLLADSDGSLWAATEKGVVRWKANTLRTLDKRNGLPCDDILAVIRDNRNSLWLDAQCGFISVADSELQRWREQPNAKIKFKLLDIYDGAQPAATNFRPTVSKSPDGRLWFANNSILQMVDPGHLNVNHLPPPVHVEEVVADDKTYSPQAGLTLPALTREIEIDYTAISLAVPQKVQFRYQLEGHDPGWEDAETRRAAFYNDLRPGHYRFRVIACNNDGVWNEAGATLDFTILPAYFQTTWFLVLCCAAIAGMLWLLYSLRLRQLATRMQTRLEERLEEREAIARDLHDTLLQGFFSAAMQLDVANDRIPADSPAKPLVERVIELMKQVGQQGRAAIRSLRSPERDPHDLEQAFSEIREEFSSSPQIDYRVVVEGAPRRLHAAIWDDIFRIGREAIINAFRHSGASKIEVDLEYTGRNLRVLVRDDGCGIDAEVAQTGREGHWGLSGMRERAEKMGAKLVVLSRADAGTEVQLSIPGSVAFESAPSAGWSKWFTRLFP